MTETSAQPKQASSRLVRPRPLKWHQRLAALVISVGIKLLSLTIRYRWVIPESVTNLPKDQPLVICVWHNRLALSIPLYLRFAKRIGRKSRMAGLVSASKDGSILARVLESFGMQPVRGSSSRRGPQALRELTTWAGQGYDLAVTPDGPRGPCYRIQPGVISLAQLTGAPILPSGVELSWKFSLRSWDKFQVPLPFTVCRVRFADPLWVSKGATVEDRERALAELAQRLESVTVD